MAPTPVRRTRIPQQRIAETVAGELRDRILAADDEYRLPTQDQLVQEFGVSFPSVREAIRILETEGLVTVRRGAIGGAEIRQPDEAAATYHLGLSLQRNKVTLADLAAGLQLLEPMCAAECARRSDRRRAVVPLLTANVEATAALITSNGGSGGHGDNGVAFTQTAREFHDLVVALTPNATVRSVVSSLVALWSAQEQAWAEALTTRGEYPSSHEARHVVRTHQRIVDAIAAGDADEAARLARVHLAATQTLLLERFDDGVVNASSPRARQAIAAGLGQRAVQPPSTTMV